MLQLEFYSVIVFTTTVLSKLATCSERFRLVWADEFDGNEIDTKNWKFDLGDGCPELCKWGNQELQWYTNSTDNAAVVGGRLVIQALRHEDPNIQYTSARILTKGKRDFKYGRIEVRAKFPYEAEGTWPAIWMLPTYEMYGKWPMSGEIDIAVMPSNLKSVWIYGRNLDFKFKAKDQYPGKGSASFFDDFHVYAVHWEKDIIRWFIDGEERETATSTEIDSSYIYPYNAKYYLIINMALGGNVVPSPENTLLPKRLEVDYIRVYQRI